MIGRRPVPTPPPEDSASTSARLARLTAQHDQVLAAVDDALRRHHGNGQLVDALLDLRNILRPPARPA